LQARPVPGREATAEASSWVDLALAVLCTATAIVVHRNKLGFGLRCIQQNEGAASMLGVNAYAYKTAGFSLSAKRHHAYARDRHHE
jgi:branched-chain amino acid transport system permease protein